MRLDFQEFALFGPTELGPNVPLRQTGSSFGSINSESNCKDDLFVVTQSNRNQPIPILCGMNEGHHSKSDSATNNCCLKIAHIFVCLICCNSWIIQCIFQ